MKLLKSIPICLPMAVVLTSVLFASYPVHGAAGLLKGAKSLLDDAGKHADDAAKVGKNGMQLETFGKELEALLEAGKNDDALRLARDYGGENMVKVTRRLIAKRELVSRFVAARDKDELIQAERMRDIAVAAGESRLGDQMTEVIDKQWADWRTRVDQAIKSGGGDVVLPEESRLAGSSPELKTTGASEIQEPR